MQGTRTVYISDGDDVRLTHYNIIKYKYLNRILFRHSRLIFLLIFIFFWWGFLIVDGDFHYDFMDTIYFMVTTVTSIGYGPVLVPSETSAAFYALFGAGFIFSMISAKIMRYKDLKLDANLYGELHSGEIQKVLENDKSSIDEKIKNLTKLRGERIQKVIDRVTYVFFVSLVGLVIVIIFGAGVFAAFEKRSFENGFFWSIATITTLGLSDVIPSTVGGKVFNLFFATLAIPFALVSFDEITMYYYRYNWNMSELEFSSQLETMNSETFRAIRDCKIFDVIPHLKEQHDGLSRSEFVIANLFIAGKLDLHDVANSMCQYEKIMEESENQNIQTRDDKENTTRGTISSATLRQMENKAPQMNKYDTRMYPNLLTNTFTRMIFPNSEAEGVKHLDPSPENRKPKERPLSERPSSGDISLHRIEVDVKSPVHPHKTQDEI